MRPSVSISLIACLVSSTLAQTFQRLGGCPELGCILPPDQYVLFLSEFPSWYLVSDFKSLCRADFLAGQYFDIRLEVHSPINGTEARVGEPDPDFKFTITKKDGNPVTAAEYFEVEEPELERWDFSWHEGKTHLPSSLIQPKEKLTK